MECFARNSALRAALDPATDDLLFDIVINQCGARAHRRPPAAHPFARPRTVICCWYPRSSGWSSLRYYWWCYRCEAPKSGKLSVESTMSLCHRWNRDFLFSYLQLQKAPRQTCGCRRGSNSGHANCILVRKVAWPIVLLGLTLRVRQPRTSQEWWESEAMTL